MRLTHPHTNWAPALAARRIHSTPAVAEAAPGGSASARASVTRGAASWVSAGSCGGLAVALPWKLETRTPRQLGDQMVSISAIIQSFSDQKSFITFLFTFFQVG